MEWRIIVIAALSSRHGLFLLLLSRDDASTRPPPTLAQAPSHRLRSAQLRLHCPALRRHLDSSAGAVSEIRIDYRRRDLRRRARDSPEFGGPPCAGLCDGSAIQL